MDKKLNINVHSEIGTLRDVILHTPGKEVENMTPDNAQRALYSDILNLAVVKEEYSQFENVLKKTANVHYVENLLSSVLQKTEVRQDLINDICNSEAQQGLKEELKYLDADALGKTLIQGLPLRMDCISNFLSEERFALQPLHNFFFTRDASVSAWNTVVVSKMANFVRERETHIMNSIFNHAFSTNVINPSKSLIFPRNGTLEGGDILIASSDVILFGIGKRTKPEGVDYLINQFSKGREKPFYVIVQELPESPESFIHLDMVFTFLSGDRCMIYEPLLLKHNKYHTIKMTISPDGKKEICTEENIIEALKKTGIHLKPLYCGGRKDEWIQEREQWHSGANFFAIAPGKVIGYARNVHTVEELADDGFEILKATDVINNNISIDNYAKCMITLEGSELARGGGGARCMSMPTNRDSFSF